MLRITPTTTDRTLWAEFHPGFEVCVRYLPMRKLQELRTACKRKTFFFDPDTHQRREKEEMDEDKFERLFAEAVVVDWRGLTPDVLRALLPMDEYPQTDVPFSVADAIALSQQVYGFSNFLWMLASEFQAHDAARRAALTKNSSPTPGAPSASAAAADAPPTVASVNNSTRGILNGLTLCQVSGAVGRGKCRCLVTVLHGGEPHEKRTSPSVPLPAGRGKPDRAG